MKHRYYTRIFRCRRYHAAADAATPRHDALRAASRGTRAICAMRAIRRRWYMLSAISPS